MGNFLPSSPLRSLPEEGTFAGKEPKTMARTTPVVQAETVTWSVDRHEHHLTVGTPAWYGWLEEISTFAFVSDMGTFTARKEPRQHGGTYWKAYRQRGGQLHR